MLEKKELLLLIIKYLKDNKRSELQALIEELQPYDVADLYTSLPQKHHHKFILFSTPEQIAMLLAELDADTQLEIIQRLGIEKSSKIMDIMENDDLADLLSELSVDTIQAYLQAMKQEESKTVQHLMNYPPETAGGIMTNRFVWIRDQYTVREAVEKLKSFASYAENIYYLYVLDQDKKLAGVVSYRDLLISDAHEKISEIMYSRVISVPVEMDQEEVARIIERYDFIALPVVDADQRLLGIVTVDDVIDVMITEANEDFEKITAAGKSIDFQTGALTASLRRLPWLVLLLCLGVVTGSVISGFEQTLEQVVALTFFMPMIAGMTGNTGTQSLAIVVRGLASEEINAKTIVRLVFREARVGLIIGSVCGILIAGFAYFWLNPYFGIVVGVSLFITLIIGTMAGTVIPLMLYRFKIDPAIASGPLITTLNDIFSLFVYFGLATLLISKLI